MIRKILPLLTLPLLLSCSDIIEPDDVGSVLLEIEVVNYAWTPTFFGFVVESDGHVYRYDRRGASWEEQDVYSPEELNQKFAPNRELVATRPASEVSGVADKVRDLPSRDDSEPVGRCADAGSLTYRAYKYNSHVARYVPVLLRVEGDWAQLNREPIAQELIAYIRALQLVQEFLGCDP